MTTGVTPPRREPDSAHHEGQHRCHSRALVPALVAALVMAAAPKAQAAEVIALRWSAPPGCPTGDEVLAEVHRLVGPRVSPDERPFEVAADVHYAEDGTYRVRLEIPGDDGPRSREVSAASCTALGQATALILAMIIDPEAVLAASPEQTSPKETLAPAPEPPLPPPEKPPPLPAPAPARPISIALPPPSKTEFPRIRPPFAVSLHLPGDLGSLPGPAIGFGGAIAVLPARWRFELGGLYLWPRTGYFTGLNNAGTKVDLFLAHATVGLRFLVHPKIEISPALRFEAGRLRASSFGVLEPGEGASALIGLGLGGRATFRLTRCLFTNVALDSVFALAAPTFVVVGFGTAHTPSAVLGRLAVGIEVRF